MIMNIALCTDEKYSFPCGVCITSILENNKNEECNIYILTTGLKKETIEKIEQLKETYHQNIEIKILDESIFKGLKISDRFPVSIYFRYLLPQLLEGEKTIYLDCDTIVTKNLKELWQTNIEDYACGVVEDQMSDDIRIQNRIGHNKDYFNSGMLLINLEFWRKNQIAKQLIEFIYNNPEKCIYPDQDALNYILHNKVRFLEYKYNFQEFFYLPKEETFLHRSKWRNLIFDGDKPTIIHYTNHIKPWIKSCTHPDKTVFLKYHAISPWKNKKIKSPFTFMQKIAAIIKYPMHVFRQ